jgi:DNA-binding PadR family transcriptional regulator
MQQSASPRMRRGCIAHNRETGVYALTDSGRATLAAILEDAGLK